MNMSFRATRAVAAILSVPVLLAGASCSQDASAETVTSVLDTGDTGDALTLPPAPRAGQTASGSLTMDLDVAVTASGQDVEVDMRFVGDLTTEVVEVSDDGGYTLRSTFHDVTIQSSEPAVVSEMERAIPDGLTYDETYDESGERVSSEVVDTGLTDAERESVEEFVSQAESGTLYAPGAPVGLGAAWTATTTLATGGGAIEMAVRNELSSLT
jgi:hypothetical protein